MNHDPHIWQEGAGLILHGMGANPFTVNAGYLGELEKISAAGNALREAGDSLAHAVESGKASVRSGESAAQGGLLARLKKLLGLKGPEAEAAVRDMSGSERAAVEKELAAQGAHDGNTVARPAQEGIVHSGENTRAQARGEATYPSSRTLVEPEEVDTKALRGEVLDQQAAESPRRVAADGEQTKMWMGQRRNGMPGVEEVAAARAEKTKRGLPINYSPTEPSPVMDPAIKVRDLARRKAAITANPKLATPEERAAMANEQPVMHPYERPAGALSSGGTTWVDRSMADVHGNAQPPALAPSVPSLPKSEFVSGDTLAHPNLGISQNLHPPDSPSSVVSRVQGQVRAGADDAAARQAAPAPLPPDVLPTAPGGQRVPAAEAEATLGIKGDARLGIVDPAVDNRPAAEALAHQTEMAHQAHASAQARVAATGAHLQRTTQAPAVAPDGAPIVQAPRTPENLSGPTAVPEPEKVKKQKLAPLPGEFAEPVTPKVKKPKSGKESESGAGALGMVGAGAGALGFAGAYGARRMTNNN